jgi:phosphoribosylaminoimidazole (AIR) synthetase
VPVPPLCEFMREQFGLSVEDSYTTYNNGVGFVIVAPCFEVGNILRIGQKAGYVLANIGCVVEGESDVMLDHEGGAVLHPPGD